MLPGNGPRRFNELKRMIGGISQRMLTLTLRGRERDGSRTVFPIVPPRVDYELTERGHGLSELVKALGAWALSISRKSRWRGRASTARFGWLLHDCRYQLPGVRDSAGR
jgi:DNA-binding HxlR family transcriptional regulator